MCAKLQHHPVRYACEAGKKRRQLLTSALLRLTEAGQRIEQRQSYFLTITICRTAVVATLVSAVRPAD